MLNFSCIKCHRPLRQNNPFCYRCFPKEYMKIYYNKNREKLKKNSNINFYKNYERERARQKKYTAKNKEKQKERFLKYWEKNREEHIRKCSKYYNENKEALLKKQWQYRKKRLKTDLQYYIKDRLSSRIRMAIMQQTGEKTKRTIELLGADIDTVRKHIESKWLPDMTWENHSITGWHIDHIVPCDNFDLTDLEQQKQCFHYTNLQPLWYLDNLEKSNEIQTFI